MKCYPMTFYLKLIVIFKNHKNPQNHKNHKKPQKNYYKNVIIFYFVNYRYME